MTDTEPGGHILPTNTDGVRAELSEGAALISAHAAVNRSYRELVAAVGNIPIENVHTVIESERDGITLFPAEWLEDAKQTRLPPTVPACLRGARYNALDEAERRAAEDAERRLFGDIDNWKPTGFRTGGA